jgi:hypothetical protein
MADAMWQEHPSSQAGFALSPAEHERLEAYTLRWKDHHAKQAQKSDKDIFFEENAEGSSQKWGDQEDEEFPIAPLWNYGARNEGNASSSVATPAEESKNGSSSGKEEKDPNSAELPMQKEAERSDAIPKPSEKFKVFLTRAFST